MTWEYLAIPDQGFDPPNVSQFNQLGANGWELFAVSKRGAFLFKRGMLDSLDETELLPPPSIFSLRAP